MSLFGSRGILIPKIWGKEKEQRLVNHNWPIRFWDQGVEGFCQVCSHVVPGEGWATAGFHRVPIMDQTSGFSVPGLRGRQRWQGGDSQTSDLIEMFPNSSPQALGPQRPTQLPTIYYTTGLKEAMLRYRKHICRLNKRNSFLHPLRRIISMGSSNHRIKPNWKCYLSSRHCFYISLSSLVESVAKSQSTKLALGKWILDSKAPFEKRRHFSLTSYLVLTSLII